MKETREIENQGPHCKDGRITFLLLKAQGQPCGEKISHDLNLTIRQAHFCVMSPGHKWVCNTAHMQFVDITVGKD